MGTTAYTNTAMDEIFASLSQSNELQCKLRAAIFLSARPIYLWNLSLENRQAAARNGGSVVVLRKHAD